MMSVCVLFCHVCGLKITSSILNPQNEYEYEYDDGDDIAHHFSEEQHRESKECATKKIKEKKKSVQPIIFFSTPQFTERHGFVHLNNKRRKEREIWRRVYDAHSL